MRTYPRIVDFGPRPTDKRRGIEATRREQHRGHYGKPCLSCGEGTTRVAWIEVSYFRGEDEGVRICFHCAPLPASKIIELWNRKAST